MSAKRFRDIDGFNILVEEASAIEGCVVIYARGGGPMNFDIETAREIAREILRLTGDDESNEQSPPQAERCVVAVVSPGGTIATVGAYRNGRGELVYTRCGESPRTVAGLIDSGYRPLYEV